MERLKVGERIVRPGYAWRGESDRYGEVVDCYYGVPTGVTQGTPMVAVRWADGTEERGFINGCGTLRTYIIVPTAWMIGNGQ
jgi:hypothetical protein